MLKKLYSKRSGFTLVEIIIAFAVFAIMASMICQILDLAAKARMANVEYQEKLDEQERLLTMVDRDGTNYKDTDGEITVKFSEETAVKVPYDRLSAKPDAEEDGEGLNYFVPPYIYGDDSDTPSSDTPTSSGGSQISRMDTRITGTAGFKSIQILKVIKDTHVYDEGDEYAIPEGHTRYYFMCAADGGDKDKDLIQENVPFAQYRLYFYHQPASDSEEDYKASLDAAKSAQEVTDKDGTYTVDYFKKAVITDVGYLKKFSGTSIGENGITSSNVVKSGVDDYNNKYTITQTSVNTIRIGSPFDKDNAEPGMEGLGVRFRKIYPSYFYVEFEGDPHLTVDSFGYNAVPGDTDGSKKYEQCPVYANEYDSDGNPEYNVEEDGYVYVNIYGAYLNTRHYKD